MRFIELDRNGMTYFDAVVKLGCGPGFVRNRSDAFEQMIREQGLQFWFRFWLTFTMHHEIKEFYEINRDIPGLIASLFKGLHYHFVQASNEEAITYCWNTIFACGAPAKRVRKLILDEMYQFLEIGFACALGEVFFKWLYAENVGGHCKRKYWTVPKKYLDPEYKPGFLEVFLLCEWGNKFVELLGVTKNEVPWVKKLLQIPLYLFEDRKGMSMYHMEYTRALLVRKCLENWKLKIRNMRAAIQQADCKRQMDDTFAPKKPKKVNKVRFLLSDLGKIAAEADVYLAADSSSNSSKEIDLRESSAPNLMNFFPEESKTQRIEAERVILMPNGSAVADLNSVIPNINNCAAVIQNLKDIPIVADHHATNVRPASSDRTPAIDRSVVVNCHEMCDQHSVIQNLKSHHRLHGVKSRI